MSVDGETVHWPGLAAMVQVVTNGHQRDMMEHDVLVLGVDLGDMDFGPLSEFVAHLSLVETKWRPYRFHGCGRMLLSMSPTPADISWLLRAGTDVPFAPSTVVVGVTAGRVLGCVRQRHPVDSNQSLTRPDRVH
ncbi:hypothetical protein C8R47DRAFT_1077042 [Mycena vitilis]|nr:hypothetical protein C8R47DRAFT_1078725 [Mycena vitilis]KAJ6472130.1 hypothetical protein C8R47DRAFT_1077042 [Mycena vitilis]